MPNTVFRCDNPKCEYAIATDSLNDVQLRILRRHAKTCPECNVSTQWREQVLLLDTQTIQTLNLGGSNHESLTNERNTKTASQRRKAARYDGFH